MIVYRNKSTILSILDKKKEYKKKLYDVIGILEFLFLIEFPQSFFFFSNNYYRNYSFFISSIISFYFSLSNTFLHVTDPKGNLEVFSSAGKLRFEGRKKIIRKLVLKQFFRILRTLKVNYFKKSPIALHFKNVGSYGSFIIDNVQKIFDIKIFKVFDLNPYNGCRKKKKRRK